MLQKLYVRLDVEREQYPQERVSVPWLYEVLNEGNKERLTQNMP